MLAVGVSEGIGVAVMKYIPADAAEVATTGLILEPYGTITGVFDGVLVSDAVGVSLGVAVWLAVVVADGVAEINNIP